MLKRSAIKNVATIAVTAALLVAARPDSGPVRVLAFGGSVGPDQTPLDLERALKPLDGHVQRLLFAGGDRRLPTVQVEERARPLDLRAQIGRVLGWGEGLGSTYRPTTLRQVDGDASRDTLLQSVIALARPAPATLLLLGVGHGNLSPEGDRTELMLWGADLLTVDDLAGELDAAAPQARVALVLGHCYAGDFARVAYRGAWPGEGVAPRCALLATTADRLADGCSPRRDASPTFVGRIAELLRQPEQRWDLDGDGALSLAELHLASLLLDDSVNVPVLSSERLLRDLSAPEALAGLDAQSVDQVIAGARPLQAEAIARLADSLQIELSARILSVQRRGASVRARVEQAEALRQLYLDLQERARLELVDAIAQRWPALLNPFRADFEATLAGAQAPVEALLRDSDAARSYRLYDQELDALQAWMDPLLRQEARLQRLSRSLDDAQLWPRLDSISRRALRPVLDCERAPLSGGL